MKPQLLILLFLIFATSCVETRNTKIKKETQKLKSPMANSVSRVMGDSLQAMDDSKIQELKEEKPVSTDGDDEQFVYIIF